MNTKSVLTIAAVLLFGQLQAAVLHVPSEYGTIQEAIDMAETSDTVLVAPGQYNDFSFDGKDLVVGSEFLLHGNPEAISETIIADTQIVFSGGESRSAQLAGFTIASIHGVKAMDASPVIQNNRFISNKNSAIYIEDSDALISHNKIDSTYRSAGADNPLKINICCSSIITYGGKPKIYHNTIRGMRAVCDPNKYAGALTAYESEANIRNNQVHSNLGSNPLYMSGILLINSQTYVDSNTISNTRGSYVGHIGGLAVIGGTSSMSFNVISNNKADPLASKRAGIVADSNAEVTIINNTLYDHFNGVLLSFESTAEIRNTILWNQEDTAINIDDAENPSVTYSNVEGGWDGTGNLDADPMFSNPDSHDFSLQAGSPMINAGDPDGIRKGDGSRVDIGAIQSEHPNAVSYKNKEQGVEVRQYPNPFRSSTTIEFTLPRAGHVQVSVINLQGQAVAGLLDEQKAPGKHTLEWDASGMPEGVYIARVQFDGEITEQLKLIHNVSD